MTTSTTAARVDPRERAFRCSAVELDAARERVRQTAEQEVRVRHRRLRPAASVTGGSRIRAGALRPDPKSTTCITPDDGAAARADRVEVDGRQPDRHTRDRSLARALRVAVRDQADVRGSPAHVEGDRILFAGERGESRGADDARSRA